MIWLGRGPSLRELLVEASKLADYLFDRKHPVGGSTAEYFLGHGFSAGEPGVFVAAIKAHALAREVVHESATLHGTKFAIECDLDFPDGGKRCVRSVWIREPGGHCRLVTSYPRGNPK